MRAGGHPVEIVFPFAIGDRIRAVFHEHPHAGNSPVIRVLDPVAVAINIHLTDDRAALGKHAALELDLHAGAVARGSRRTGLGGVHAVAAQGARPDFQTIGQRGGRPVGKRSERKTQFWSLAACRVGDRCVVEAGTVFHVEEPER